MIADGSNTAVVENENQIGVLHRGNALGDNELGGFGNELLEALPDERVGFGIHRAGEIVENENLRFFM